MFLSLKYNLSMRAIEQISRLQKFGITMTGNFRNGKFFASLKENYKTKKVVKIIGVSSYMGIITKDCQLGSIPYKIYHCDMPKFLASIIVYYKRFVKNFVFGVDTIRIVWTADGSQKYSI